MKLLLDHDVPDNIAFALQELGYPTLRLREVLPITTPDDEVLRYALQRELILITCNRGDFLALAQLQPHAGIIVLIRRRSRAHERAALIRLIDAAGEPGITGNITFA